MQDWLLCQSFNFLNLQPYFILLCCVRFCWARNTRRQVVTNDLLMLQHFFLLNHKSIYGSSHLGNKNAESMQCFLSNICTSTVPSWCLKFWCLPYEKKRKKHKLELKLSHFSREEMDTHYIQMDAIPVEEVRASVPPQLKHFETEGMQADTPLDVHGALSKLHSQSPSLYWLRS